MRTPATIKPHMDASQMLDWVRQAPDAAAYKRRMAIWLTATARLYAHQVSDVLGVSTAAVWLWVSQYNKAGPRGLARVGRGNGRPVLLQRSEITELRDAFAGRAARGESLNIRVVKDLIKQRFDRTVSDSYVRRLCRRHDLAEMLRQSHTASPGGDGEASFVTTAQPWRRSR